MPRLRRSDLAAPGIRRRRRGRGFSYSRPDGTPVDAETAERIAALAIPPAWEEVWICPFPHGHIQAIGTDAAGRRQYRYHDEWRRQRDLEKFERMVRFGRALPRLRKQVGSDLGRDGYPKERVLATAVRLLDIGYFRIGGEEYAEEHETFGLSTMEREHVTVHDCTIDFDFPAKGGQRRRTQVNDPRVAEVLRGLKRRRGGGRDLLAWKNKGRWVDVKADDVNAYLKEAAGDEFSAKDFRTWSATVLAAATVATSDEARSVSAGRRIVSAVCKEVSAQLGNTPAVCRGSYIDPRVFDRHEAGETIRESLASLTGPLEEGPLDWRGRQKLERAVVALLETDPPKGASGGRAGGHSTGAGQRAPRRSAGSSRPRRRSESSSSTSASSTSRSKQARSAGPRRRTSEASRAA